MLNKIIVIGRLTKDPELRNIPSGVSCTNFTVACERNYKNQQGEKETDFIPVVTWRGLADNCAKYLVKGRLVAVSGRLQVRSYDNNQGERRYISEIVADEVQFLEWGDSNTDNAPNRPSQSPGSYDQSNNSGFAGTGFEPLDDDDDELPF